MTPIPGPIVLLVLPLLAAGVVYLVRHLAILAALLSAATTAGLALLCLLLPLDQSAFVLGQEVAFGRPIVIVGLTLMLEPGGQAWLAFIFGLATVCYLFAWRMSQGRSFFSFSLVILSLYALMALVQSFSLSLLVFALSATLAVFIIQGGQPRSVRGAQRYLVVTLLAVPLLLLGTWLFNQSELGADGVEIAQRGLLPAALGFGLLLAALPFGTWMPAIAADAPPVITAFIFTAAQGMVVFLVVVFMRGHPDLAGQPAIPAVAQLAGLTMVAAGGVIAAAQRDFGRLFGYAALSDLGYFLLAWGTGGNESLTLGLLHLLNRAAPIVLMAAALAIVRHRATTDEFGRLGGVARRLPISTAGLMLGGLALAGFPLTAGFPTHWAVARAVLNGQWAWDQAVIPSALAAVVLMVASGGITLGLLRGLSAMLRDEPRPEMGGQPIIASVMVLALAALSVVIALYPQLFLKQALALF